jgi:hypothetical protein
VASSDGDASAGQDVPNVLGRLSAPGGDFLTRQELVHVHLAQGGDRHGRLGGQDAPMGLGQSDVRLPGAPLDAVELAAYRREQRLGMGEGFQGALNQRRRRTAAALRPWCLPQLTGDLDQQLGEIGARGHKTLPVAGVEVLLA